jgi:hypothetical protein
MPPQWYCVAPRAARYGEVVGLVPELVELVPELVELAPESVALVLPESVPAALGCSEDPGCVASGCRPLMPLVSLEPSGPVLSASARPGAAMVSAPVRVLLLVLPLVRPLVLSRLVVSVPSVSMRVVSAPDVSAPVVSIAPTRPGRALVSTPAAPEYPDVSGRATPADDVSWAARRGANAASASAAMAPVR